MSLLAKIRAATGPLHEELEAVLDIPKQVKTREQYAGLLARFAGLYGPWEERLASFAPEFAKLGIELSNRMRVPNLQRDLAALDARVRFPGAAAYAPPLEGFPEAIGSLYVLEGSTLGGQVLTRHFRETMGLSEDALHFFASHGPAVGKFWREFCIALEAYGASASPEENARVMRGAEDSFRAILRWFQAQPVR